MQRLLGSKFACFLGHMVWLVSLAFLLVSHGHEQLHEQPCAPDAHLPAKMSNPLPDGVGHQGWVSEPSLVI